MSDRCTWGRIEVDDEGTLAFRVSHSLTSKDGTVVVRHEDALDLLTPEQLKVLGGVVTPVIAGVSKRLAAMVDVDAMEVALSTARKSDPRLKRLSLDGEVGLDGSSSRG